MISTIIIFVLLFKLNILKSKEYNGISHQQKTSVGNINSDPCINVLTNEDLMGNLGEFGTMHVVSGSVDYAKMFVPVINYYRNTLNIPDADEQ